MNYVPSTDQIMGLLRTYLPALGALLTAYGATKEASWVTTAELTVGPLAIVIGGVWSLVANMRSSIMRKAAKPVNATTPAPQIVLPDQEKALADKLPDNVTSQPMATVAK
jgi:hypothetical protein